MATLFTYTKDGTQITRVADAAIEQGGLDYKGADYIMHNTPDAIKQLQLYNGGKSVLSQEVSRYRAGEDGRGIACSHQFMMDVDGDGNFFNHAHLIATHLNTADNSFDIILFHWARGKIVQMYNYANVGGNASVGGMCFDGLYYYIVRTSSSIPSNKVVRKYHVSGKTLALIQGFNMNALTSGTLKDICFDSKEGAFWLVDGTTIRKFDATFSKELDSWAGPTGAWGITCDEHHIYIQGT